MSILNPNYGGFVLSKLESRCMCLLTYDGFLARDADACDDIDFFHQEQINNDFARGVEDHTGVDGQAAGKQVKVLVLDQFRGHEGEDPRDQVQENDQEPRVVDVAPLGGRGLASKEDRHGGDAA